MGMSATEPPAVMLSPCRALVASLAVRKAGPGEFITQHRRIWDEIVIPGTERVSVRHSQRLTMCFRPS